MIVKFFKNPKKTKAHGVAAINYLLDQRVNKGTARILLGNEIITRKIVNSIKGKQKLTIGCLSFQEKNINREYKYNLMKDFEDMLLPGLHNRFNILWVEHVDKGRLELNFVIPKIELVTKKSLNPFFYKQDLKRVEIWQDLQNFKYGFTNPKNPKKRRTVEITSTEFLKIKDYETLDNTIKTLVKKKQIKSRDQLISICESNGIKMTRKSDNYISLRLPNSKKARRFKNGIYNSNFTSMSSLEDLNKEYKNEIINFENRNKKDEVIRLQNELNKFLLHKKVFKEAKNKDKIVFFLKIKKENTP